MNDNSVYALLDRPVGDVWFIERSDGKIQVCDYVGRLKVMTRKEARMYEMRLSHKRSI